MHAPNPHARRECGARMRGGTPCHLAPMPNGRCRMHGGATPRGPALPQFKHGRYSRSLPTRLAAQYEAAQSDPVLMELRDEIALNDARLADLLGRVDTGESGSLWGAAAKAHAAL